jgi:acyl-CoA thioester hydrolase
MARETDLILRGRPRVRPKAGLRMNSAAVSKDARSRSNVASGSGPPLHSLALRIYYEDTDAGGLVYHANYLKFAERGRTEMLRSLGFEHRRLHDETGLSFTVRRCDADYVAAARLDDGLTVETRVAALGGATLDLEQRVCRDGRTLVRLDVLIACVGRDGRPRRLPSELRAAIVHRLNLPLSSRNMTQKAP